MRDGSLDSHLQCKRNKPSWIFFRPSATLWPRRLNMERRLAAVLAFDMVGYSRLVGADEQRTLATFKRHRSEIFNPRAAQYHGRIVKFTGDGALIEFPSVVDSVSFAVEAQLALYD